LQKIEHALKCHNILNIKSKMPNTSSAKKALRQTIRRTLINKMRKTRVKTAIKKVLKAVLAGDKMVALKAFQDAQPELHRAVNKRIFHKNNIARKLSKLSAKIKAMPGQFVTGKIA
jgi:small subunit ribosomal protein S20